LQMRRAAVGDLVRIDRLVGRKMNAAMAASHHLPRSACGRLTRRPARLRCTRRTRSRRPTARAAGTRRAVGVLGLFGARSEPG